MRLIFLFFFIFSIIYPIDLIGQSFGSLEDETKELTHIIGRKENGSYLYTTAGNMMYSVGSQNGSFPEIGFHIPGEMGGIWQHPIKLLDGFKLKCSDNKREIFCSSLEKSDRFITYPFVNQFEYGINANISVTRTDFIPDNLPVLVVEYSLSNNTDTVKNLNLTMEIDSDLMPVWMGSKTGMEDGTDILLKDVLRNTVLIKDSLNDWYAGVSSDLNEIKARTWSNNDLKGNGIRVSINLPPQHLRPGQKQFIRFYIAGSTNSKEEVLENIKYTKNNIGELFKKKKSRFNEMDKIASITIPDSLLMEVFNWGKYNIDWLVRDVEGLGRGVSAGLPDYPWFFSNDQSITFKSLVGTRGPELFYDSFEMLKRVSNEYNNNSGKIIHEVSTNGYVYDGGRMEESQLFLNAVWNVFRWYGDIDFLKNYYEQGEKIWEFLQENDTDNNLYVEGYGGTEIEGLNDEMLDVAVWTQVFLSDMAKISEILGENAKAELYENKANTLKRKINDDWWLEKEGRFADFMAQPGKALELINTALSTRVSDSRNIWAKKKLEKLKKAITSESYKSNGYSIFYNSSSLAPLVEGIADSTKALTMLKGMSFFNNKFGLYVTGIARPDNIKEDEKSVISRLQDEPFNYNEAVMIAGTSSLALAETRYRGVDAGMKYIKKILNSFSFATPGTTYEVAPDYGMFVQAWNNSGINTFLIQYVFGVSPCAYKKKITIAPELPSDWGYAKIKQLMVGNNLISIDIKKEEDREIYFIESKLDDWSIYVKFPKKYNAVIVNNGVEMSQKNYILLTGKKNKVEFF